MVSTVYNCPTYFFHYAIMEEYVCRGVVYWTVRAIISYLKKAQKQGEVPLPILSPVPSINRMGLRMGSDTSLVER